MPLIVKNWINLTGIWLSGNHIGSHGIRLLIRVNMPLLKYLDISNIGLLFKVIVLLEMKASGI